MEALPYYKWHWQDWRANRRVQRMPWQAKGPYRELLDELWAEGSLPTALVDLADIVGCTEAELADLWPHISPCFQERDGRLYEPVLEQQRLRSEERRRRCAGVRLRKFEKRMRIHPDAWKVITRRVFERDDYTCVYCGLRGGRLECDHIVPLSKGGSHVDGNLATACFACNRAKGAKLLEEWVR